METVYIETSILSHATAWPSRNPTIAALQDQAKQWLKLEAPRFRLATSQFVIDEASRGDPDADERRLAALENVAILLP
ncbi:MAG: DNA-binding protein, partial [Planctomycetaceae bacterium]